MKLVIILAFFASSAFAAEIVRSKKQLSVFSVVAFPNEECQSTMDKTTKGTCQTTTECTDMGGTRSGNCASGFGVCCVVKLAECGGDITQNRTYIQNPGFPGAFTTQSKTCKYTVRPKSERICQLRLDFDELTLNDPADTTHLCGDTFAVSSPTSGLALGTICGQNNAGHHIYMETGNENPAGTITITTEAATGNRKWNIKVSQILCEATYRAPTDCTQYFTGLSNIVSSFNHPGLMTRDTQYMICIRQEEGHCTIAFTTKAIGANEDFRMTPATNAAIVTSKRSRSCNRAQIQIRSNPIQSDVYCGRTFSSEAGDTTDSVVYAHTLPFGVLVSAFTDAAKIELQGSTGFRLKYHQLSCGERETPSKYSA